MQGRPRGLGASRTSGVDLNEFRVGAGDGRERDLLPLPVGTYRRSFESRAVWVSAVRVLIVCIYSIDVWISAVSGFRQCLDFGSVCLDCV